METSEIAGWLREEDPARLEVLWREADAARRQHVGDAVHLRGLAEISNFCARNCAYCGLRAGRTDLKRYRMTAEEILECARLAVSLGYGTLVMQSGEDYGIGRQWLAETIRRIKGETPLAVTLSLGERPAEDLREWRDAGADRYLLRFETSDRALYDRIHPPLPGRRSDRFAILRILKDLGYETGSGVMIGIPGQTFMSLAEDIRLFRELDLEMIGVGPYLPHPCTPMGGPRPADAEGNQLPAAAEGDQVPNSEIMAYKAVALSRLACPSANIPATTALATVNFDRGYELGLSRGANVVMPNITPPSYRALYEIYPAKSCIREDQETFHRDLVRRILAMGRTVGSGRGGNVRFVRARGDGDSSGRRS